MDLEHLASVLPKHWELSRQYGETIELWTGKVQLSLHVETRRVFVSIGEDELSLRELVETAELAQAAAAKLDSDWWDDAQRFFDETSWLVRA